MEENMIKTAIKFLRYSFEPIGYDYERLTKTEKDLCDKEEVEKLLSWLKKQQP